MLRTICIEEWDWQSPDEHVEVAGIVLASGLHWRKQLRERRAVQNRGEILRFLNAFAAAQYSL